MEVEASMNNLVESGHKFEPLNAKAVELDNLYPALVECFGIIFLGYMAGRFNLITEVEAKGMNTFVGNFSLPALIFISLCQLDLSIVNYKFLLAILIAKAVVFFGVLIVTFTVTRTDRSSKTGLYSIFVTQSNDFALGYPILKAIYGQSHPEYSSYMYLLAPISLVVLNPVGFVILEISRANNWDGNSVEQPIGQDGAPMRRSKWRILFQVLRGVLTNPILLLTIAGVIVSFALGGQLPQIVATFLKTLGSAFSATALFLLGLRMVNKMDHFKGAKIIAPLILVALKLIAMPIIAREVVSFIHAGANESETNQLSNFAFLYGTFPTAPSVFVYASKYNVLTETIAGSMVVCTILSAPIMFISARLLSIKDINPADYIVELDNFLLDISVLAFLATLWVAFVFIISRKWRFSPHDVTFSLILSQSCACLGAILWSMFSCTHGWKLYVQFSVFAFGVYSSRLNAALLSITLVLIQLKPICFVQRIKKYFLLVGFGIPAILVLILLLVVQQETPAHGDKTDPNFQYGTTQTYVALVILILSFVTTSIALIMSQRLYTRRSSMATTSEAARAKRDDVEVNETNPLLNPESSPSPEPRTGDESELIVPIEDLMNASSTNRISGGCSSQCCSSGSATRDGRPFQPGRRRYRCDTDHRNYCSSLLERYQVPPAQEAVDDNDDDPNHEEQAFVSTPNRGVVDAQNRVKDDFEILRHTVLLLLLLLSMFIGLALCVWTLVMDGMSGIYVELVFLDGFLNFGQGLFTLAIFGFETKYIMVPIRSCFRRVMYGQDSLVLPRWEDLEDDTKQICQQFMKHHIANCMESIVKDVRIRLNVQRAVFKGSDLVQWLLEVGLARDHFDGVVYGRHLIKGRVIRHVENCLDFYDDSFLYRFV